MDPTKTLNSGIETMETPSFERTESFERLTICLVCGDYIRASHAAVHYCFEDHMCHLESNERDPTKLSTCIHMLVDLLTSWQAPSAAIQHQAYHSSVSSVATVERAAPIPPPPPPPSARSATQDHADSSVKLDNSKNQKKSLLDEIRKTL